jgi:outer membrane lipoprotein-sorting protein
MSQELSAEKIVKNAYDLMQGESNYAELKMIIHRPKWNRSISMKSWAKGNDYSLIYITAPAKEQGQVFLKRESEMWNWLPSINRMIKIPPSMMMQSWMGSDLTNDDLINESSIVNDYDHKILGMEKVSGYECYKIELIPHEQAPVVWGKIISWISTDDFFTLKNEYYDEEGELKSIETLSGIKNMGDRTIPTVFEMVPVDKEDHKTTMIFENIEFNIKIENSFFSIQNMKSVR